MLLDANTLPFDRLGQALNEAKEDVIVKNCCGQRYLADGLSSGHVQIYGTPGNALGAYLDGGEVTVFGNVQEAVGDTMNAGRIVVHGIAGDALGYAMRGGSIFVRDSAGYRAGIHMKAYADKQPLIVIGGRAGSFLGEYQAGGVILVLGRGFEGGPVVNHFCGVGMHGGAIYLRTNCPPVVGDQLLLRQAEATDMRLIERPVADYCALFDVACESLAGVPFWVITPNTANPYKQLYTFC